MNHLKKLFAVAVGVSALLTSGLDAATLILDSATPATSSNLTTSGTLDWAYWIPTSTVSAPAAPTNEKAGGSTIISSISNVGGTGLRGSSSVNAGTAGNFTYTDGTSPASGTVSAASFLFNSSLGTSAIGNGLSFTIGGDPLTERVVKLFLGGFGATGELTLSLTGATNVTSTQVYSNSNPKPLTEFTLRFRPDSASDVLNVSFITTAVSDLSNGHLGAQAVAVGVVPEPGVIVSLLGGIGVLAVRRRRTA